MVSATVAAKMKVKEVQRTANIAWSSAKDDEIYLAAGMCGSVFRSSFLWQPPMFCPSQPLYIPSTRTWNHDHGQSAPKDRAFPRIARRFAREFDVTIESFVARGFSGIASRLFCDLISSSPS